MLNSVIVNSIAAFTAASLVGRVCSSKFSSGLTCIYLDLCSHQPKSHSLSVLIPTD